MVNPYISPFFPMFVPLFVAQFQGSLQMLCLEARRQHIENELLALVPGKSMGSGNIWELFLGYFSDSSVNLIWDFTGWYLNITIYNYVYIYVLYIYMYRMV